MASKNPTLGCNDDGVSSITMRMEVLRCFVEDGKVWDSCGPVFKVSCEQIDTPDEKWIVKLIACVHKIIRDGEGEGEDQNPSLLQMIKSIIPA